MLFMMILFVFDSILKDLDGYMDDIAEDDGGMNINRTIILILIRF